LSALLPPEPFDLVLSWGVLHHCRSFTRALAEVCRFVKPDGLLYVYLYGRESQPYEADLALFKERVRYNTLADERQRYAFLLARACGDPDRVHNAHDIYAPLINRRLEWPAVERLLRGHGFEDVVRTIDHTELLVRAIRGGTRDYYRDWILPRKRPPYWFTHHERAG
jgi:SAM-dependent methyltransferase